MNHRLTQTLSRLVIIASSRNDVVLAILIVSIIFMMILPLPTALVDVLIATNMMMATILLMVAMYLPSPLAFSSFPSVLLITTLFRLGISIATTRLILLQGDAGYIIETFGNFVVGGNLIVGLVVFLILSVVQFIVITKGAERVAEVSARFSLDAMPGKQMSIDADLRAGAFDVGEARRRRSIVEEECQFYGAMDGAMKFVKGDSIAGLIIVVINLVGGIAIGTMLRGLTAGDAVQVYSILTIGDGLVAQIPALFIAICAGIIVTRVRSGETPSNVGKDIGSQILGQPRALLIAAPISLGIGLIPGMPTLTFVALAAVVGTLGFALLSGARGAVDTESRDHGATAALNVKDHAGSPYRNNSSNAEFLPTQPILICVASHLQHSLNVSALEDELLRICRSLYLDLGVPFPLIVLRFNDAQPPNSYRILLFELPVFDGKLHPGAVLVHETEARLHALQVPFDTDIQLVSGLPAIWVDAGLTQTLSAAGIPFLGQSQILVFHLAFVLKKYASDFIGIQETRLLLTAMEEHFPDLVKETLRAMPIQRIAEILQRLVSEDISVRNLRIVLEVLVEWGPNERDPVLLTEYVRISLKRFISHKYSNGRNILPAYLLAQDAEEAVRGAIRQSATGSFLDIEPDVSRKLVENIRQAMARDNSSAMQKPVLLTSMDVRRYLRKLIEQDISELPVLSYQELTRETQVQPLARVGL